MRPFPRSFLFFVALCVFAGQPSPARGLPLELHGTISFSSTNQPNDNATGFSAGAAIPIRLGGMFSLWPELNLLLPSGNVTYLEVPLLLSVEPWEGKFRPFFQAGPSVGVKMTGRTFKHTNAWLRFGAGLRYVMSESASWLLGARYGLGLLDITRSPGTVKLDQFQLGLGLLFEI